MAFNQALFGSHYLTSASWKETQETDVEKGLPQSLQSVIYTVFIISVLKWGEALYEYTVPMVISVLESKYLLLPLILIQPVRNRMM